MPYYPFIDRGKELPGDSPNPLIQAANMSKDLTLKQVELIWMDIETYDTERNGLGSLYHFINDHTTDGDKYRDVYYRVLSRLSEEEYEKSVMVLVNNYGRFDIGQLRLRLTSIKWDHVQLMNRHIDLIRQS